MTDILEPGHGKSNLWGGTPVVIMDDHDHWLYGWSGYLEAEAQDHHLLLVKGIRLGVYIAYLEARFPEVNHLTKRLVETDTIHAADLQAIDRAITITQRHANEIEQIQNNL